MKRKKPLYVLRQEGKVRDGRAFERGHGNNPGEKFGVQWLQIHLGVTDVLSKFGYDTSNERVRAVAALAVRAALDPDWVEEVKADNGGWFNPLFPQELEIPHSGR